MPATLWTPDLVADLVADRTLLDLHLDAERKSADRLASTLQWIAERMDEHAMAVLLTPSLPFLTVGDLVGFELERHRAQRREAEARDDADR